MLASLMARTRTVGARGVLGLLGAYCAERNMHATCTMGYDSTRLFTLGAAFWITPFGQVPACFDP